MQISYEDFSKVDVRVGTVLSVKNNKKARQPALVVKLILEGKLVLKNLLLGLLIIMIQKILLESKS